jgi:DNA-binding MltR family transcriptional regulator
MYKKKVMTNIKKQDNANSINGLEPIVPGYKERAEVLFRIGEELEKESDRGCALVASAYLENEISQLLERFFIELSSKSKKILFDFNGPVGTFSSKIEISFALGLITHEIKAALSLVRKVRNEFAHLHEPLDFDSDKIKQKILNILPNIDTKQYTTRQSFIKKIQSIAATVHHCHFNVQRSRSPKNNLIPVCENPSKQELEIAARRLMEITTPDITYEQAMELVKYFKTLEIEKPNEAG